MRVILHLFIPGAMLCMGPSAFFTHGHAEASSFPDSVGAITAFDQNNALDLAGYCDGSDEEDDLACARQWVDDAREQDKHMYVSPGTYYLSKNLVPFSGMHLRCADLAATVFKKVSGTSYPHFGEYDEAGREDISIENCGFDMNGDEINFASAISLSGHNDVVSKVTVRGNRIFDSTGMKNDDRSHQRQYIVVTMAEDVLIENNTLSHGGRIKAGRPGRRIVIGNNSLDFVNDNGITVVARSSTPWPDGSNVSEDILIEGNTIVDPTVTGIFFGADGGPNGAGVTVRRIAVVDNDISGPISSSCIGGTLPDYASYIHIDSNTCLKDPTSYSWANNNEFDTGVRISRTDDAAGPAERITVSNNAMEPTQENNFDNGSYFVAGSEVCLIENLSRNNAPALWAKSSATVHLSGNDWGGYDVRIDGASDNDVCLAASG